MIINYNKCYQNNKMYKLNKVNQLSNKITNHHNQGHHNQSNQHQTNQHSNKTNQDKNRFNPKKSKTLIAINNLNKTSKIEENNVQYSRINYIKKTFMKSPLNLL